MLDLRCLGGESWCAEGCSSVWKVDGMGSVSSQVDELRGVNASVSCG